MHNTKLFNKKLTAISLAVFLVVFLFFFKIIPPFVPSDNGSLILLGSAFTSLCLAGVFYLGSQMFLVVWKDEQLRKAEKIDSDR